MKKLTFKINSQKGLILKAMGKYPNRWFVVADFCGTLPKYFVGYKAAARISELQKEGILISRWSNRKTALGGRLKEYKFAQDVHTAADDKEITIWQLPLFY